MKNIRESVSRRTSEYEREENCYSQIKEDGLGGTCRTDGGDKKLIQHSLPVNLNEKVALCKPGYIWANNIILDLKGAECKYADWIKLTRNVA
jgi:hypothetical protein